MNLEEFRLNYHGFRAKDHISIDCEQCGETRYPGKSKAQENIAKNGKYICQKCGTANSIPNRVYTEEGRQRIAAATSYQRSDATKQRMSEAAHEKWSTPQGQNLKKHLAKITSERQKENKFEPTRRRGMYRSKKLGRAIPFSSSYELKAFIILENDVFVTNYEPQVAFSIDGRCRCLDLLVNGNKGIEIKPKKLLSTERVMSQIEDSKTFCQQCGYTFEVWTETALGFQTPHEATKWADEILSTLHGVDYVEARRISTNRRAKKHYHKHVATQKVTVQCKFCDCAHEVLEVNYLKNMERNGRYICEREGGFIAGSKPKKKKVNPHAAEGKKECVRCHSIKLFEEFGEDKSRADGYASRCKMCRAEIATAKYREGKKNV